MTFEKFMQRVDAEISHITQGFISEDFCDAPWYSLFEDVGEMVTREDIVETLAEYDDIFAQMVAL